MENLLKYWKRVEWRQENSIIFNFPKLCCWSSWVFDLCYVLVKSMPEILLRVGFNIYLKDCQNAKQDVMFGERHRNVVFPIMEFCLLLFIYFSDFHSQLNRLVFLCRKIFFLDFDSSISSFCVCTFKRQLFNSFLLFLFFIFFPQKMCQGNKLATFVWCKSAREKLLSQKSSNRNLLKIHNWTALLGRT